ncbi:lysophospholipid acyltransferase family protein [Williamsia sterculiae]|uniref:Lyso-ornithine lipid acyltransferase n=1 Tax=Williamsia sterculiae TaxID=1344003 RepID=A0A1N7G3Y4_9NOCA|nr:lysophospholipid acyltransferase family protein [Williamsia sterculiae]SIS07156.1 lyso-ornithine lipid acyltransferase [Williamsia sterculiae]
MRTSLESETRPPDTRIDDRALPVLAHPWLPHSPCATGCVDTVTAVRRLVRWWRLTRTTSTALGCLLVGVVVRPTPRLIRRGYVRWAARTLLRALGVTVEIDDRRPHAGKGVALVVANHTSILDILAIASVVPARFVAKAELTGAPGLRTLVSAFGIIPIRRSELRSLPDTVAAAVDGLHGDDAVGVFPEGTTWCGRSWGRFRPAMFQAAIDASMPVLPVHVGYRDASGPTTTAAFVGDDALTGPLARVMGGRDIRVVVRLHELQSAGTDRRELAARCERIVFGDLDDMLVHGGAMPLDPITVPTPVDRLSLAG